MMPARLRNLSWRDLAYAVLPFVGATVVGVWLAVRFIDPAPPRSLTLAVGDEGSADRRFGLMYRDVLAENGVRLELRVPESEVANDAGLPDVRFVAAGSTSAREGWRSLGEFYVEPMWVFYRQRSFRSGRALPSELKDLKGRRIAIGGNGSASQALALDLLRLNGLDDASTRRIPEGGLDLVERLRRGDVDVVMVAGPPQSALVWSLLYTEGVGVMSFSQAEAYGHHLPWLRSVSVPHGAVDLKRNIPARDLKLVAQVVQVIVRESLHPALTGLLMQAGTEVHSPAGLFQKTNEFPRAGQTGIPLASEAERYYKQGRPLLQRFLPFWAATLVDRTIFMLVPLLVVMLPLLRFAPVLYAWRIRSRIYRRYGELKFLESEILENPARHPAEEWLSRLDRIETEVNALPTPLAFADMLYTLRSHIELVRKAVLRLPSATVSAA